jgi:hypothetical protein
VATPDAPPYPTLARSARLSLWVLAGVLAFCVASIWLPPPSGAIAITLFVLIGGALSIVVLKDVATLREDRRVWRRLHWADAPAGTVAPEPARLVLDLADLKHEHVARWRRWRPWCVGLFLVAVALAVAMPLATGDASSAFVAAPFAVIALLRDAQLALTTASSLPASVHATLRRYERAWLRTHLALVGVVLVGVGGAILGVVAYMAKKEPLSLRLVLFGFFWGWIGLLALLGGLRFARRAFRRGDDDVPGDTIVLTELEPVIEPRPGFDDRD